MELEVKLASNYIASINTNESIARQEQEYWRFRNYSIKNKGDHELRREIYQIHTKEFKKQLSEIKC